MYGINFEAFTGIPQEALAYLKNKNLHPAFSYKDVWHEENATGFTAR
jgi:hypothetical protein